MSKRENRGGGGEGKKKEKREKRERRWETNRSRHCKTTVNSPVGLLSGNYAYDFHTVRGGRPGCACDPNKFHGETVHVRRQITG